MRAAKSNCIGELSPPAAAGLSRREAEARQLEYNTGGPKERDNYLGVLKSGGSDYPVEILRRAGLDMASPAPYRAVVASFKDTMDQAEALLA